MKELGLPIDKELEYTETKIGEGGKFFSDGGGKTAQENSFSNYSAWHLRTLLFTEKINEIKSTSPSPEADINSLLRAGAYWWPIHSLLTCL